MPQDSNFAELEQFVSLFNAGDLAAATALITTEFFDYVPQGNEWTAPEAFQNIGQDLRAAIPDLRFTVDEITHDGEQVRARMTASGTFTQPLWGKPGNGAPIAVTLPLVTRFENGKMAMRWEGFNLMAQLRTMGLAPMPENAHLKPKLTPRLPEIIQRLQFNGMRLQEKACTHLDHIKVITPAVDYCADCAATGDEYPAVRMCVECGYVGCCDLSVNKHIKKHCEQTGHPLMRSIQPGEAWLWCYPDAAFLSSRHLVFAAA